MPATILLKPSSAGTGPMGAGTGGFDPDGGSVPSTGWIIKAFDFQGDFFSRLLETTGQDDETPIWENNELIYGSWSLRGFMVAGASAVGIQELDDQTLETMATMIINYGTAAAQTLTVIVESIAVDFRRQSVFVGISMAGRVTDSAITTTSGDLVYSA